MMKFVPGNQKIASTAKTLGRRLNTINIWNHVGQGLSPALSVIRISWSKTSSSIVVAVRDEDKKEQKYHKTR
jgi:hypothetical protein